MLIWQISAPETQEPESEFRLPQRKSYSASCGLLGVKQENELPRDGAGAMATGRIVAERLESNSDSKRASCSRKAQ